MIAAESPAVLHALQYAKGAFAAGQLSASEIVCRNILDEEPDCAGAHELLGSSLSRLVCSNRQRLISMPR